MHCGVYIPYGNMVIISVLILMSQTYCSMAKEIIIRRKNQQ